MYESWGGVIFYGRPVVYWRLFVATTSCLYAVVLCLYKYDERSAILLSEIRLNVTFAKTTDDLLAFKIGACFCTFLP